jgi:hypothetical protein
MSTGRFILMLSAVLSAAVAAAQAPAPAEGSRFDRLTTPMNVERLLERQAVPVTTPTFAVVTPKPPPPAVPESMVVDARCRLGLEDSGWFLLEFLQELPAGFPKQMRILPTRELETLQSLSAARPGASFRVSGQTTAYRGRAYVLVLSVAEELPTGAAKPLSDPSASPAPNSQPTGAAASGDDMERIRQSLTRTKPPKPVLPTPPAPSSPDAELLAVPSQTPAPAGDILIDRVVRLSRAADGQWMEARFEADNTLQERPLPLLPCRVLERAEAIPGKVRITGVIHHYQGHDFLLLRKAFAERDMGQF